VILVIDNYDSFTYNLVQYLGQCGVETVVRRNDEITLDEIQALNPAGIMLSPGPCTPSESGICLDIVRAYLNQGDRPLVPLFGVCLGHQAIGQVSGGTVKRADKIMHGKSSMVTHDGKGLFEGMPNPFRAIRYHSLVVTQDSVPADFIVTATAEDDGEIMGLRHKTLPIEGVQFHPESVLTEDGMRIIENFVKMTGGAGV
jgi:para-aminobenzoate synthetase component II